MRIAEPMSLVTMRNTTNGKVGNCYLYCCYLRHIEHIYKSSTYDTLNAGKVWGVEMVQAHVQYRHIGVITRRVAANTTSHTNNVQYSHVGVITQQI